MDINITTEVGNNSTQLFENTQGNLVDYLICSLKKTVPGNHIYKIYALSTLPKPKTLFKSQEKKSYERKILLLLSEKKSSTKEEALMTSIEAHEYYMIEEETLNIYISKVDTTGCIISTTVKDKKISATKQLISSYINYHLEEKTQPRNKYINVHIFARSQPQYLFTKSSNNLKKHILDDTGLLKWWKKVLGQAFTTSTSNNLQNVRKWYYIPGYASESKARSLIKDNNNDDWIYGYPYNNEKFWEIISIGGEFSGEKIAGFFWVNVERSKSEDLKKEEYEAVILENLKENVGGIMVEEEEFIRTLQKFFELEFCNEEITLKSSEDWSKIFEDLCVQKGINDGVVEFKVEQPQIEDKETSPKSIEMIEMEIKPNDGTVQEETSNNKRKPANPVENNGVNVNVLSSSLIKRVKRDKK
ncbi:10907_t:CDS:2 [Rhizophagus irregularis]|nr:10907_t:CDS:2 [Rhizophagus irregularis]